MSKKVSVKVVIGSIIVAAIVAVMALASNIYVETIYPFQDGKHIYATCGNLYQTDLTDIHFAHEYGQVKVTWGEPEFWRS